MFYLEIEPAPYSVSSDDRTKKLETLLKELFLEELHFEDSTDFLAWAKESFPLIKTQKNRNDLEITHILIVSWFSPDFCSEYYGALLKNRLVSEQALSDLSIQHFDFELHGIPNQRFCLMEIKMPEDEIDESYISSLRALAKKTHEELRPSKEKLIQQGIEKARRRFHRWVEGSVLEDLKSLLAVANQEFLEQRSSCLLSRLILSQHLMHKTLMKWAIRAPEARHAICRLLSSRLTFPFTSKHVLGVFVGIHLTHKYEFFSEEHLLRAIQKLVPDSQCIPGSIYAFQRQGAPFKFIYLEVEKRGGETFSLNERRQLFRFLQEQAKWSVEKLQPSVFMISNEEEIAKNILVLSREVSSTSDIPQIIIHLEEQTENDVKFRIIMVRPFHKNLPSLDECFQAQTGAIYLPGRTQTVRHLEKQHPIQAHVFRLCLPKNPSLLRADVSLNFYAARNQICDLLTAAMGPFRDYNGGIILKQGEILEQFKRLLCDHPSDLIENFFYGLTPIEIQSTIALDSLTTLFELFLHSKNQSLVYKSEYFFKSLQKGCQTYCMFRTQDTAACEFLSEALKEVATEDDSLVYTQFWEDEDRFLGYIFESQSPLQHEQFSIQLQKGIDAWKKKLASLKTLRLATYATAVSLDPRIQGGEDKNTILKMLFEGLTRIDEQGKVALGAAKSCKLSRDKKTYTFHLRSAFWSNGMPVTAADFAYAWKAVLSPHFKTPFAYLFYPIKNTRKVKEGKAHPDSLGVRALDETTLEVTLQQPTPYFLELTALPQFFPVNQMIDSIDPSWPIQHGEKFVCNGAFVLKTHHPIHGYELVKNPLYLDAEKIQLDSITIKKARIPEIQEMLLHDQIDWAGAPLGFINFSPFPRTVGEHMVFPNEFLHWYIFNTQKFPFNHPKIRQAFSLIVNRMRLLQQLPTGSWPAFTILPLHQTRAFSMEENREKGILLFREALQELKLQQKKFPPIKIMYAEGGVRSSIAKIIQQEWEETLGIHCEIEAHEWHSLFARVIEGDFQISAIDWIAPINDPSYTLEIFRKTNPLINFPKWHHPKYERMLDRALKETNQQKRLSYYGLAEDILLQEAAVLPLLRTLPQSIKNNRLKMVHYSSMRSWDFKWTTIQTP